MGSMEKRRFNTFRTYTIYLLLELHITNIYDIIILYFQIDSYNSKH